MMTSSTASMTRSRTSSQHLRFGSRAAFSMRSSRSRASGSVRVCPYFWLAHLTRLWPQLGTKSRALSCWNCALPRGLSPMRKWQQRILTCSRYLRSAASKSRQEGYRVQSLQLDSSNLRTRPLQKELSLLEGLQGAGSGAEGSASCGAMGEGGCLVAAGSELLRRRSLDSMVSSSMTMRWPASSAMTALSSPRSPKDYSSSSGGSLSWTTSESSARFKLRFPSQTVRSHLLDQSKSIYTPSIPLPEVNIELCLHWLYRIYNQMEEKSEKAGAVSSGANFLWKMMNSRNMQVLREQQARLGTAESRQTKEYFENSMICLLGNLLALSSLNLLRGMNPQQHELKHRWSKPLHLFLLSATVANLAVAGFFGYQYVSKSPEAVQEIFQLAKDPRIYLDVDKVAGVGKDGHLVVERGTLRQTLQKDQ